MKKFLGLLVFLSLCSLSGIAWAQGLTTAQIALQNNSGYAAVSTTASVYVCVYNSSLVCNSSNRLVVYKDPALSQVYTQPITPDPNGYFYYYVAPGTSYVQSTCFPNAQCQNYPGVAGVSGGGGGGGVTYTSPTVGAIPVVTDATSPGTLGNGWLSQGTYGSPTINQLSLADAGFFSNFSDYTTNSNCVADQFIVGPNPFQFDPNSYVVQISEPLNAGASYICESGSPTFVTAGKLGPIFYALDGNYNTLTLINNSGGSWNNEGTLINLGSNYTGNGWFGENDMTGLPGGDFPYAATPAMAMGFSDNWLSPNGWVIYGTSNGSTWLPGVATSPQTGPIVPSGADGALGLGTVTGTGNFVLSASPTLSGTVTVTGTITAAAYLTNTNCSSSASPAVCGSSAAGSVALPTNAVSSSIVVNTTAVTANSQILVTTDDTLGAKLGVTCNSTLATLVGGLTISARTPGTSFTIANNVAVVTNPLCVSFMIIN